MVVSWCRRLAGRGAGGGSGGGGLPCFIRQGGRNRQENCSSSAYPLD